MSDRPTAGLPDPADHTPVDRPRTPHAVAAQHGRRVWRMRKLHQTVDAELWPGEGGSVELRYALNGEPTYRRSWPSRDEAMREAIARRAELERDGWSFHW